MTARRPYASRGFAQRRSRRSTGGGGSPTGFLVLLAVLAIVGASGLWLRDRLPPADAARDPSAAQQPQPPAFRLIADGTPIAGAAADAVASNAPDAADGSAPTAAPEGAAGTQSGPAPTSTATTVVTLRRWDTTSDVVEVDPLLVGQLDQALAGVEGTVSIAVKDLGSGRGAVLDGSREMQAASLFKLPVLYSVFEAGVPLNESLLITEEARSYDLGTMELGAGETLTVAEALERMVTISDTTSALMLAGRVGSARITYDIAAVGMEATHYSLERMTTSSLDMLDLLELIARGHAVSPTASADMLHLLLRQKVNDRLPRLLPDEVRVAHKTGNLPGIVNDVGILYGPNSTVVVAALVSDTSNEAAASAAIARVGLIASSYYDAQPSQRDRLAIPAPPARAVPPVWREPRPTATPTEVPTPEPTVAEPSPTPPAPPATPTPRPGSQPAPNGGNGANGANGSSGVAPVAPPATATRVPPATPVPPAPSGRATATPAATVTSAAATPRPAR